MERDYGSELDDIREEMHELRASLADLYLDASRDAGPRQRIKEIPSLHGDEYVNTRMRELGTESEEKGLSGAVEYIGVYASGGNQNNWIGKRSTDVLLALIENESAGHILASIGSNERLHMLLALLKQPMSVAALVRECGYNSTGQVYHHLKPLIASGIVREADNGKGVYCIRNRRVQGLIMLLCGIADLVDQEP